MRKRGDRTLKDLYDRTKKIKGPEITPVLEGSCRIQGPVEESDHELRRTNSGIFGNGKRYSKNKSSHTKVESGTCNVCSAPCSSCMHFDRAASVMESNIEGGISATSCQRKETESSSSFIADELPIYKSRACDDLQHVASETSNFLSSSSSHDTYSENAQSKATLTVTHDASEDVDMPPKVSSGEAVKEESSLKEINDASHCLPSSSYDHEKYDLRPLRFSAQAGKQCSSECYENNISCISGDGDSNAMGDPNMVFKVKDAEIRSASTKSIVAKEIGEEALESDPMPHDPVVGEGHGNSPGPSPDPMDSSTNVGSSEKADLAHHFSLKNDTVKVEPSDCSIDITYSSSGARSLSNAVMFTALPDNEESKACRNVCSSSAENLKNTSPSQETKNLNESEVPSAEALNCTTSKGLPERSCSISDTGTKGSQPQVLPAAEAEAEAEADNSGSDIEDDVKVCDICGDAGREESLAVCSRCSDGAEHTYCMRIMLDKIPEGDWLCEECKHKEESEIQKSDKSEAVSGTSKAPSPKENNHDAESIFNPKILSKLDTKVSDTEARGPIKGLQSPHILTNRRSKLEVALPAGRKSSELSGGPIGTPSPMKKPALTRESSLKNLDKGKVKPAILTQGSQPAKSSQEAGRLQISAISNPSKSEGQGQMPRGRFSKSISFNSSNMKGKVKQLIEPIPPKQKSTRDLPSRDMKKDGLVRTLTKTASFTAVSSGRSNIESVNKTQSLNSPRAEDPRGLKQVKERHALEKKNSFILDRPRLSPSPTTGIGVPLSRTESKVAQGDVRPENMHDPGIKNESDGTHDFGRKEVVKQSLYVSKSSNNPEGQKPYQVAHKGSARLTTTAFDRPCIQLDPFPDNGLPQNIDSTPRGDKMKDPSLFSSSRPSFSSTSRTLRCQRCNEAGHATELCSNDKLRTSAQKNSAERSLKEGSDKPNKWKDAIEATISKSKIQKNSRLLDQSADLGSELSCGTASKVAKRDSQAIFSSRTKNLDTSGGTIQGAEIYSSSAPESSKTIAFADGKRTTALLVEAESVAWADVSHVVPPSDELNTKHLSQFLPDASVNSLRVSAIPELEFIWQGDFEVMRIGRLPELCDGVQAHLSTCASPKVFEAVSMFPYRFKLDEVPCLSLWPSQFHGTTPNEDNIALFFFAKDIKSYEKSYKKLLEYMVVNDLALKGIIDGVELLIFSSNKLPEKSQRWNRLLFLWGTFRGRSVDCFEAMPDSLGKSCGSTLDLKAVIQGPSSPVISEVSVSEKSNLNGILDKGLSRSESSAKMKGIESKMDVDLGPASSNGVEDMICQPQVSPVDLNQRAVDDKQPSESCVHRNPFCCSRTGNELRGFIEPLSKPRIDINITQVTPQSKSEAAFLGKFADDLNVGEAEIPVHIHANFVQPSLTSDGILPPHVVSTICTKGPQDILNEARTREKEINEMPVKAEVALCNDLHGNLSENDPLRWESRFKRKSPSSCSMDNFSQASGETSRSTDETALWKERVGYPVPSDERGQKKMRLYAEGHASSSSSREESMTGRFSSKVHPFLNEQEHRHSVYDEPVMPESSKGAEKPLFLVGLGSATEAKTDVIHVLDSDDEEPQESNAPNLELALGGKKKSTKKEILPLLFPLADSKNDQHKVTVEDADDASASLSLSLAFPVPEELPTKPAPKPEQFLPERPCIDRSLLLFGRVLD